MPTVRDLLLRKGTDVVTVSPAASVLDAARLMNDHGIGGLLVLDGDTIAGIFTERDILRRVVAAGLDPAGTAVREVLTADVLTCRPEMPIEQCGAIMTARRLRHLPVVDADGRLHGLVTSGDVLAWRVAEQQTTIAYMESYVYGTA